MAELDLSHHSLNNSSSKQKFSFPKTQRFRDPNTLYLRRHAAATASMMPLASGAAVLPPSDTATRIWVYEMIDAWLPWGPMSWALNLRRTSAEGSASAAVERYYFPHIKEMQLGGPLKDTKILAFIPGPGNYDSNRSQLDHRGSSLRAKLPDNSIKHLVKARCPLPRTLALAPTSSTR
jgi:hypothetical protein